MLGEPVSINECEAIRYLDAAAWSADRLAEAFDTNETMIRKHLNRECDHTPLPSPIDPPEFSPQWMKAARADIGLTQAEVADRIGTSRTTVAGWEHGGRSPSPGYLIDLWALLDSHGNAKLAKQATEDLSEGAETG